jgi:hypothetical protein
MFPQGLFYILSRKHGFALDVYDGQTKVRFDYYYFFIVEMPRIDFRNRLFLGRCQLNCMAPKVPR